jgi:hypothetical protein
LWNNSAESYTNVTFNEKEAMNKLLMPYEAPELFLISVRVEKGFAVSSDIEPGEGGGELGYDETY